MLFDRVEVRETTATLFADNESFGQFYLGLPAPSGNPPVVDAGDDHLVSFGETVILDGSASFDPDGGALTFSWALVATEPVIQVAPPLTTSILAIPGVVFREPVVLTGAETPTASFSAPESVETFTARLTVVDVEGNSETDEALVTVLENKNRAVFVSDTLGSDTNRTGTMERPFKSVQAAVDFASISSTKPLSRCTFESCDVYVEEGLYADIFPVQVRAGVSLYGGFVSDTIWTRTASAPTTITNTTFNTLSGGDLFLGDVVTLQVAGVAAATVIDGFEIVAGEPGETLSTVWVATPPPSR